MVKNGNFARVLVAYDRRTIRPSTGTPDKSVDDS